jgi:hypothetical protein
MRQASSSGSIVTLKRASHGNLQLVFIEASVSSQGIEPAVERD